MPLKIHFLYSHFHFPEDLISGCCIVIALANGGWEQKEVAVRIKFILTTDS